MRSDETVAGLSPIGWATKAVALWRRLCADALVVEVNQGGDMVRTVIAQADASVPVQSVHARRGKYVRAEPVAVLYEQGRVKHVGGAARAADQAAVGAQHAAPTGHAGHAAPLPC